MSAAPSLVIATRNAGKLREIRGLLEPHGIEVLSLAEFDDVPEVEETGETFAENAALKAVEISQHLNQWTLGEDSGLMVDALDGRPGIYSARYSGPDATDEKNNAKLLEEMDGVTTLKRGSQYVCSLAVSDPTGNVVLTEEATCRGRIGTEPRGENGFGYDPYFTIVELHKTFGELAPIVKKHLSHRARAFERVTPKLISRLKK
ncbi:MAG: XTP/dITP diphosphatase [Planctomycetaceae bacterium]|jgi:XTP/dITP diphosphohydrolase|nr:XTP/dITP diphosphatase [Planctomycetaceae bacterium]MDC0274027.1 XTP/dITP diphosphatase [Planctomycetaceae bacterium]MDG2388087.1 XTP/dITP diphosphatase [Planctomycetaceae bacterium]